NVMRVPAPSAPGGQRVVVTDFGLALGEVREEDQEISRAGELLGSPGYMSPEQVEGEPLSPASDLYAFGVVLFEMVTGRLPFVASSPVATALKRLREPPPSPCELVPGLGPVWERVLLRALARRPDERFATACELIEALREAPPASAPARAPVARRSVAVLDPRNLSGRSGVAWLSTALAEMLSAELAVGGQVRLLSGESVARMRQDLALPDEEGFAADTLRRIRAWSGVDLVLTGSYLVLGREEAAVVRLNLRLQDVATGEAVLHLTETGPERELLELVSRSGTALRRRLGLSALTSEQVRGARSALPAGTEAARLYAEGLAALRNHDAATAVQRLERVVERQSDFAPAWSALAAALKHLFQEARAREAARRAYELSASLSREERLLVQARHHEAQAEWAQAIEAYQTLFEFFPDNVEYGTALVTAQVAAGQVREAQETLAALRRLPPPLGEDARLDLTAAVVSTAAGDFAASRRLAGEAVARARQVDQGQLAAAALIQEAYAARNLGEPTQAVELLEESERLYLVGGDRGGAARAMLVRAVALVDMGRLRAAEVLFTVVLGVARELQGASLVGEILANAGGLSCHLGELEEALRRAREGLEVHERLGMLADANICKLLLGKVQRHRGELEEARRLLEEAAHEAQVRFGDDYCEAWAR
ncbi:MAG TPA: protein kinase, partial [Myxococcaceae bacterium]|nr:protein kinase [Myxococcaceae bacterium]